MFDMTRYILSSRGLNNPYHLSPEPRSSRKTEVIKEIYVPRSDSGCLDVSIQLVKKNETTVLIKEKHGFIAKLPSTMIPSIYQVDVTVSGFLGHSMQLDSTKGFTCSADKISDS